jgi:predicted N-formylglutamate amidohydrolase
MLKIIITCEHATNQIPPEFSELFKESKARLQSHEGWDIGAKEIALAFAQNADYAYFGIVSRLLIELNRSLHHPHLFSDLSKHLSLKARRQLIVNYYLPYRDEVTTTIEQLIQEGHHVLHLSVHTFAPTLKGKKRAADVGFLYDPKRHLEKRFAILWQKKIYDETSEFQVRFNFPYQGKSDGFVTSLRKKFPGDTYFGIELEVNQKHSTDKLSSCQLQTLLLTSFSSVANCYDVCSNSLI